MHNLDLDNNNNVHYIDQCMAVPRAELRDHHLCGSITEVDTSIRTVLCPMSYMYCPTCDAVVTSNYNQHYVFYTLSTHKILTAAYSNVCNCIAQVGVFFSLCQTSF